MSAALTDRQVKAQWVSMLRMMVNEYREAIPDDSRNDNDIAKDILDYFADTGLIKRNEDGKYLICEIMLSS